VALSTIKPTNLPKKNIAQVQVNIFRKKKDNTVLFIYTITAVHLLRGFDLLQIDDNYVVA
jgi:hypothetical protein